jgi:hypothetical protein
MHKLQIIFFIFLSIISFSQERVNSELPKIIDTLSTIKKATGWMKNDIGKWVSKPNEIPSEYSDINLSCVDFTEYSLLKISYKDENYFCIIHKSKTETRFLLFNYFEATKTNLSDTTLNLLFQPICEGYTLNSARLKSSLINEIYKEFQNENSLAQYDNIQIGVSVNKTKSYLRFFIYNKYSSSCGEEEIPFEKRYFETSLSNLSFFQPLITAN